MTWDFNTLKLVNTKVNMLDYKTQVGDDWDPFTTNGFDCNNYATRKMEELFARGVPVEAMRLATGWVDHEKKLYHAVLLVDHDGQTYVLDNRYPYPMEYDMLPYEWHKFWSHDLNAWEWAKDADRSYA